MSERYERKAGRESMLVAVILSFSFQPDFNGLKIKLNICHAPLLAKFFFSVILTATKHLPHTLGFFGIISMD